MKILKLIYIVVIYIIVIYSIKKKVINTNN